VYAELQDLMTYAGAVILQVLFLPLEILVALLIKLTSPGPIIYTQVRTGRDGKPFTLYKFRTMRIDAEQAGPQWSTRGDTRVTWIGRILRYTHVDEFPQLWNVLKGEIAFVGPRPERPEFEETLTQEIPHYRVRHLVKPGITGWAQVSYRYGSSVEDAYEKLQFDLHYLRNASIIMDAFVLLKTLKTFILTPR
jgi:lipopolysaccharide/colanic/teichoic acid biosynthesis glycosyltransferase